MLSVPKPPGLVPASLYPDTRPAREGRRDPSPPRRRYVPPAVDALGTVDEALTALTPPPSETYPVLPETRD